MQLIIMHKRYYIFFHKNYLSIFSKIFLITNILTLIQTHYWNLPHVVSKYSSEKIFISELKIISINWRIQIRIRRIKQKKHVCYKINDVIKACESNLIVRESGKVLCFVYSNVHLLYFFLFYVQFLLLNIIIVSIYFYLLQLLAIEKIVAED